MDNNPFNKNDLQKLNKAQFAIIPIIIVLIIAWSSFYTIEAGHRGVLLRLGAVQEGVVQPGPHFKLPFIDQVKELNVRVQKFHAKESAASKDLQIVTTTIAINFHLVPSEVDTLYTSVGMSRAVERKILVPAASNAVKAVTARFNAEDLISQRDVVRANIEQEIREAMKPYNVTIDAVNITDFAFSPEYASAIEKKQVAQQQALQAKYVLKKTKIDAQQQVVKAEAHAQATVTAAKAEAKAMKLKREAITPEIITLNAINKWDGKMPTVYSGNGQGMMSLLDLKPFLKK